MGIWKSETDGGLGCIFEADETLEEREFLDCFQNHLENPPAALPGYRYTILDFGQLREALVGVDSIRRIARLGVQAAQRNPDGVIAFVTSRQWVYGLCRLFALSMGDAAWETRAFEERQDAERWLQERVQDKFGIVGLTFQPAPGRR